MKITVSIEKTIQETQEEQKYPRKEIVFEQTIENAEESTITEIIKATNGFTS